MSEVSRREFGSALIGSAGASLATPWLATAVEQALAGEREAGSITDVPGIKVGHFTDSRRPTGCTAVLFGEGATAAVDYNGSAPGDYMVVMLQPVSVLDKVHAMVLSGGALFGLATAHGVERYLEEQGIGERWGTPNVVIPLVPGAIIYDLDVGDGRIRPDAESGYKACQAASSGPVAEGNVGAGAGATVGKAFGRTSGMKGGLGTASLRIGDVVIAALMVVNALGDIVDWRTGKIIAGALQPDGKGFLNTVETMKRTLMESREKSHASITFEDPVMQSTTIGIVATNVDFSKTQLTKIAMMANTGAARVINPYHTTGDGDQLFAVSTNRLKTDVNVMTIGTLAAEVVSEAILRAVKTATAVEGWPAYRDVVSKLS